MSRLIRIRPSAHAKIEPFIRKHHIDMTEFEPGPFKSYAEFFDRRFLPGKRTFPAAPGEMGAFAEARYFAWEKLEDGMEFPIKGHSLKPEILFGNARAKEFDGGPVILARLSPMDYHHLHYVDHGTTVGHDVEQPDESCPPHRT